MILLCLASALASEPLDRASFVRSVLEVNPELQAISFDGDAATARAAGAGRWAEPVASVSVAPWSLGSGPPNAGVDVSLAQEIPVSGRTSAERAALEREADAFVASAEEVRLGLAVRASLAFTEWRRLHSAQAILLGQATLLEELAGAVQAAYKATGGGLGTVLAVEVDRVDLQRLQLDLDGRLAATRAEMNALLHRPQDSAVAIPTPAGSLGPAPAGSPEPPDLARATADARAAEGRLLADRRANVPDPTLMASYESMWMDVEHRLMVGIAMPLPVEPGRRRAVVDAAEAAVAAARAREAAVADESGARLAAARSALDTSLARLALQVDRGIPLADQRLAAERAAFEAGQGEVASVLEAARMLLESRLTAVEERAAAERAWTAMYQAMGQTSGLLSPEVGP